MGVLKSFSNIFCNVPVMLMSLVLLKSSYVYGSIECASKNTFFPTVCNDDQYCCGSFETECCNHFSTDDAMGEFIGVIIFLIIFICCPVMCYRCCCRRTTNQGAIYSPAGTTTAVTVALPPQHMQQVPYPSVVPFPLQTPYPPQYAQNPYYGAPPPGYGVSQAAYQQALAPSAPYPPA